VPKRFYPTLEAIEQLQKADSPDKVRAEIERLLPPLGVEHYAFGDLSELKSEFTRTVPVIRARGDFIETSEKEALHKDDASLLHAKGVLRPFDYVKAPTKSQRSREVLNIVRDFGLAEGVVIPVPGIVRPAGAVWMVGHADLWRLMISHADLPSAVHIRISFSRSLNIDRCLL
jgi:hypothetical protein